MNRILAEFMFDLAKYKPTLVAHNIWFDENVVWSEFHRMQIPLKEYNKICTMKNLMWFCGIENPYGYDTPKWPTLTELHQKLFNTDFDDAHSSLADVEALRKCFFKALTIKDAKDELLNIINLKK